MSSAGHALRDVYLARQPIFDARRMVCAYEVLYRNSATNSAIIEDATRATSELLLNVLVEIGLDAIVGAQQAFVNVTREFLLGQFPLPLEADRLVLEILEDIVIDDELVAGVKMLVEQGCTLALDDVVYDDRLKPLLELVQIVKVEMPLIPSRELLQHVERFRAFPVRLLAEKVETPEQFELCRNLGFDLYQGYFLSRPQMIRGKLQRASEIAVLRLLSRLSDPQVGIDELEHLVASDPHLAYKLLRYIHSSKFSLRYRVESLRQVIVLLGIQQIRTLAMLIFLAGTFQRSAEVLSNTMIRALFCERLGRLSRHHDPHAFFTAGMLSNLDVVLEAPLDDVMNSLQLADDLRDAVMNHTGLVGQAVRTAIAHEHGDWTQIGFGDYPACDIREAYLSAISDARRMQAELSN